MVRHQCLARLTRQGANTVRVQTFGISTGNSLSFEPSAGVFNQKVRSQSCLASLMPQAFQVIAYGVFVAKQYGLRVIIPLTDQVRHFASILPSDPCSTSTTSAARPDALQHC